MRMNKRLAFLFVLLVSSLYSYAQSPDGAGGVVTPEEERRIKEVIKEKMTDLTNFIKVIGEKRTDDFIKEQNINSAVSYFLSNAIIQVSNVYGGLKEYRPRAYFNHLRDLKYDEVIIEFIEHGRNISSMRKISNNHFEVEAYYNQKFIGRYDDARFGYSDITLKRVLFMVYQDDFGIWQCKIKAIEVVETQKYE